MAWASLAAAAIPSIVGIGKSLFGGNNDEEVAANDPGAKSRRALHQQLMGHAEKGALEQPGVQAAMAQLRQVLDRQRRTDEANRVKQGAEGTETAIAQSARRGRTEASGMLDVVSQGQRQKRASLQQALNSANAISSIWNQKKNRGQQREGQLMGLLGQGAAAATQAFAGSSDS